MNPSIPAKKNKKVFDRALMGLIRDQMLELCMRDIDIIIGPT